MLIHSPLCPYDQMGGQPIIKDDVNCCPHCGITVDYRYHNGFAGYVEQECGWYYCALCGWASDAE